MSHILEAIKKKLTLNQKYNVVFFGDSTISTEWVHPNAREMIEYVLKMELEDQMMDWRSPNWNLRFINAGMSGASTKDFLSYMLSEAEDYKPDLVILVGGDNDLEDHEINKELHAKNLNNILEFLTSKVQSVVYCSAPYLPLKSSNNERYSEFLAEVKQLDVLSKLTFIDLFEYYKVIDSERFFTFKLSNADALAMHLKEGDIDPFHPNQLGQAYLAAKLIQEIFGIKFDPEKYIETNAMGLKYPEYK